MQPRDRHARSVVNPRVIEPLEHRRHLSVTALGNTTTKLVDQPFTIGVPGFRDITFTASSGRKTKITVNNCTATLSFSGLALLTFYQGHGNFPAGEVHTLNSIVIANAIPGKAALRVACGYGGGNLDVGSITGGDIGSINAPDVNLTGTMNVKSVKDLKLGAITGATMNLGSGVSGVKVKGVVTGSISAGSLTSFSAFELVQANITTTSPFSKSKLSIGTLDGGAGIEQSNIISSGNIGSIKSKFIENSVITAAAHPPATPAGHYPSADVPQTFSTFTAQASIGSVRVISGLNAGFFGSSVIVAEKLGPMNLGEISGGGGVAAHTFASLTATGPTGGLDRFAFHLGSGDLHSVNNLKKALTRLNIAHTSGTNLPQNTVFYNFNLNILG